MDNGIGNLYSGKMLVMVLEVLLVVIDCLSKGSSSRATFAYNRCY